MYNAYLRPRSYAAFVGFGFNAERSKGFYIKIDAFVLSRAKLRFCYWFAERSEAMVLVFIQGRCFYAERSEAKVLFAFGFDFNSF